MTKKMLIDTTHAEETRVAVIEGTRLADFDYESQMRKQLKGSIFLAKVTRVEPSLQAAFVNFGGNRHGFLPFSEIHPDYFRIPVADRETILAEQEADMEARQAEAEKAEEADHEKHEEGTDANTEIVEEVGGADVPLSDDHASAELSSIETKEKLQDELYSNPNDTDGNVASPEANYDGADTKQPDNNKNKRGGKGKSGRGQRNTRTKGRRAAVHNRSVEIVGGDGIDGDRPVRPSLRRSYKIQEVVKRGQIMLIQVSREERGNKGAAVTTYMSLPGRYCVLMPNSPRSGGVSRKIDNFKDRRRMKEILSELKVPSGMSIIMRTAGVERTKAEIKRDADYLMRMWDSTRKLTLESTVPALIHEEGNLIRRSIRDIYTRDIEEVIVSGEDGYNMAKDFMKTMIPSHAKRVKLYSDDKVPLFHRYQIESQINEIGEPNVTLKSGGYLVINPTEALISIDVNSGKATGARHIEATALHTNLEAAEEVSRQLRLRDLGGLVVIDFIDMEDLRNNRKVENRLKTALSADRARIQIGRISSFGLLELSRQRLNPSLTEAQYEICPHCNGSGHIRTVDSAAIMALRALEEEGIRGRSKGIALVVSNVIALYILNQKRDMLADIERRHEVKVLISVDESLASTDYRVEILNGSRRSKKSDFAEKSDSSSEDSNNSRRGGRRRGRRGGRNRDNNSRTQSKNKTYGNEGTSVKSTNSAEKVTEKVEKKDSKTKTVSKTSKKTEKKSSKMKDKTNKEDKEKKLKRSTKSAKPQNKTVKKESQAKKKPAKKVTKSSTSKPSNDSAPPHKDYEVVNEPPAKKKRGWWSKPEG